VRLTKLERAAIGGRQRLILALASAMPDRTDRMNDIPRRQAVPLGDFGVTGRTAIERAAFGQKLRPRGAMDGAVDAPATEQRAICGVDDGVNA
jgi:hypothetical protein